MIPTSRRSNHRNRFDTLIPRFPNNWQFSHLAPKWALDRELTISLSLPRISGAPQPVDFLRFRYFRSGETVGDFPVAERSRRIRRLDGFTFKIPLLATQLMKAKFEGFVLILHSAICVGTTQSRRRGPGPTRALP